MVRYLIIFRVNLGTSTVLSWGIRDFYCNRRHELTSWGCKKATLTELKCVRRLSINYISTFNTDSRYVAWFSQIMRDNLKPAYYQVLPSIQKHGDIFTDQGFFGFDQTDKFDRILLFLRGIVRYWWQSWLKVSLSHSVMDRQETLWSRQKHGGCSALRLVTLTSSCCE